jgi:uncharacterized protein YjbI with pentapeptide repeats
MAVLMNADVTGSTLSGACLDYAIMSGWVIKDVKCTHISQKTPMVRVITFAEHEFRKKYT